MWEHIMPHKDTGKPRWCWATLLSHFPSVSPSHTLNCIFRWVYNSYNDQNMFIFTAVLYYVPFLGKYKVFETTIHTKTCLFQGILKQNGITKLYWNTMTCRRHGSGGDRGPCINFPCLSLYLYNILFVWD